MWLRPFIALIFKVHLAWRPILAGLCLSLSALMTYDIVTSLRLDSWPVAMAERSHQNQRVQEVVQRFSKPNKARTARVWTGPVASYRAKYDYQIAHIQYELTTEWRKQSWPKRTKVYFHPNSPSRAFVVKPEVNLAHWLVLVAGLGAAVWLLWVPMRSLLIGHATRTRD